MRTAGYGGAGGDDGRRPAVRGSMDADGAEEPRRAGGSRRDPAGRPSGDSASPSPSGRREGERAPDQEHTGGPRRRPVGKATRGEPQRRPRGTLTTREAAAHAALHVQALTGRGPENITSLERTESGWRVGIEVLETRRIPDSTDILAEYDVEVDSEGELVGYRRSRRYYRGRSEEG
jgi:hypothetical protein